MVLRKNLGKPAEFITLDDVSELKFNGMGITPLNSAGPKINVSGAGARS